MKKLIATAISLVVLAAAIGGGFLAFGNTSAQAAADPNIVVVLRGTGTPVAAPAGSGIPGDCFVTDLFDAQTDTIIGTGTDCLDVKGAGDTGLSINRTTIFNLPQGVVVANGLTTVVPIFGTALATSSPAYTHIVGDVDDSTANLVPDLGTRRFAGRTGNVRLSGIVNLVGLGDTPPTLLFNCIFIIDLD